MQDELYVVRCAEREKNVQRNFSNNKPRESYQRHVNERAHHTPRVWRVWLGRIRHLCRREYHEETTEQQGTQCQGMSGFASPRRGFSTVGS